MGKGYSLKGDTIIIERDLTDLDIFVKDFLNILIKYGDYLVVSGFVSISTGRTRATEDVDIIVPIMDKKIFEVFFNDLMKHNFWCYQSTKADELYNYLKDFNSIRFAKNDEMFPNIEFIPFDKNMKAKYFEFNHPQKIKVKDFNFKIPPIEFEILYKEIILGGQKDLDDAKHLRIIFADILKSGKFKEYEQIIKGELTNETK